MLARPVLKPHFQVEQIPPDKVVLISESHYFVLTGKVYFKISELLDGKRTSREISGLLSIEFSAIEVCYALTFMEQQGYIVESDSCSSDPLSSYWFALDQNPGQALERLQSAQVGIRCFGSEQSLETLNQWSDSLWVTLGEQKISVEQEGDFQIVITDDYLREDLRIYNQQALQEKRSWILIKPLGMMIWLGPIFIPRKTGCWHCLAQRLQGNRPVQSFVQQILGRESRPAVIATPANLQLAMGLLVGQIMTWLVSRKDHPLINRIMTWDTSTLVAQYHTLVKRPQCSSCGDPNLQTQQMSQPIQLSFCPKKVWDDGGHRSQNPEETLTRLQHHISPIIGIVRTLESLSPATEDGIHSYKASHWFPLHEKTVAELERNLTISRSGGKGKTDRQARTSALCEAIERYSGIYQGDEVGKRACYRDLEPLAIHPNECMLFSPDQYRSRQEWNQICERAQRVPEPFDLDREIEWTPIWSLSKQIFKYLPTSYCFYGYPTQDHLYCYPDSNGCAAGNTLEEAILQGFLELVERDCAAIWWYNQITVPGVDLLSFKDSYIRDLYQAYQLRGRALWVLDISHDLGIPTFAAVSKIANPRQENIIIGFGSHFDAKLAITRALTEANQIGGFMSQPNPSQDGENTSLPIERSSVRISDLPFLHPTATLQQKTALDYATSPQTTDIHQEVLICQDLVEKQGMEMLILNQSRADIDLNVVRVIVPGMRPIRRRLAPGRLYDVPMKMEWLPRQKLESELNSLSVPI